MQKNRAYRRAADNLLKAEKADEFKLEDSELKEQKKKKKFEADSEKKLGRKFNWGKITKTWEYVRSYVFNYFSRQLDV